MKNLISIKDLSKEEILFLLDDAKQYKNKPFMPLLNGKIMASCFFEPSTRTRLSFEVAMKRLGGEVVGFSDLNNISVQKGESLYDTIKIIGLYVDVLVIRHPLEGAARQAANATNKPVINAGDGSNEHPTQTLLDLFTIQECHHTLEGLNIALSGDLLYSRAAHSLIYALQNFSSRLYFVCSPSLSLPPSICEMMKKKQIKHSFHQTLEEVVDKADILYMTRIQRERMANRDIPTAETLTRQILQSAKKGLKVLHPLPRVQEIALDVDDTEHAYYFNQAENGCCVRQAILKYLLRCS